jgi:hypothetical protein
MTGFPPPQPAEWPRCAPEEGGLDSDRLAAAVRHAARHETPWLRVALDRDPCSAHARFPEANFGLMTTRSR